MQMLCRGMRKVTEISYNTFSLIKDALKQFPDRLKIFPKHEHAYKKAHTSSPLPNLSLSSARRGSHSHKLERTGGKQIGKVLKTLSMDSASQVHSYY